MDASSFKLSLMPVIALVMGMAGSIGTAAVSLYQLSELQSTVSEITTRDEIGAQAVMTADVARLKADVEKLLSLSDDNMNKIIAINANPVDLKPHSEKLRFLEQELQDAWDAIEDLE